LSASLGCQKWSLVVIDLKGDFDVTQIASVHARSHELHGGDANDGGYFHDNTVEANTKFRMRPSVGIYLPKGVREFEVEIDALNTGGACIFTGSGPFNVDNAHPTLTLMPAIGTSCQPVAQIDSGASDAYDSSFPDLSPEVADAQPDTADADVSGTGQSDHSDCDSNSTVVACFDPSDMDGGPPVPFDERTPNSDCDAYCDDMIMNCPGTFADLNGCIAVCTEAGWQLPADGSSEGTVLSCLADYAQAAARATIKKALDCAGGDPGKSECVPVCEPYCLLRQRFCQDPPAVEEDCLTTCYNTSPAIQVCLMQIMDHDVPGDPRFCQWTLLGGTCGRCSNL